MTWFSFSRASASCLRSREALALPTASRRSLVRAWIWPFVFPWTSPVVELVRRHVRIAGGRRFREPVSRDRGDQFQGLGILHIPVAESQVWFGLFQYLAPVRSYRVRLLDCLIA